MGFCPPGVGPRRYEAFRPSTPPSSSRRRCRPRPHLPLSRKVWRTSSLLPRELPNAWIAITHELLLPISRRAQRAFSWVPRAEQTLCSSLPRKTNLIPAAIHRWQQQMVGSSPQSSRIVRSSRIRIISPAKITKLCPRLSVSLRLLLPLHLMMLLPRCLIRDLFKKKMFYV